MKNTCYIVLFTVLSIASSCRKENSDLTNSAGGTSADSYYPTTKGSEWTYRATTSGSSTTMTSTQIMSGATATYNNQTYYESIATIANNPTTAKSFVYAANNTYRIRSTTLAYGVSVELEFLRANAAIGDTWTTPANDAGKVNGIDARVKSTMKEKNISKVVNGKTFNNVIHSTVELQYNMSGGFETAATYEIYAAKGIGVILIDSNIDLYGMTMNSKSELISYTIK